NDISNGGVYSNATTATLTITGATAAMNGYQYRCSVGGPCPPAAISNSATLTVNTAPMITMQPSDTCAQPASFTVAATVAALTYQWQVNAGAGFVNVFNGGMNPTYTGATTTTLSITNPQPSMQGYTYRCMVTGACSPPATSNAATLNVDTSAPMVTAPTA